MSVLTREEVKAHKEPSPAGTAENVECHPYVRHLQQPSGSLRLSTHKRRPLISDAVQQRLWAYMGGIARANRIKALAVGGMRDHVHLLLSLSTTMSVAKAIQLIKAGSSKWMNERTFRKGFAWQTGYGAFTVGISQLPATIKYIQNQPEHHRRRGFDDEIRMILKRHGIPVVER